MNDKAIQLRREYQKQYRDKNKDKINQKQRDWRNANKDRVKGYNQTYWLKKANQLQATS